MIIMIIMIIGCIICIYVKIVNMFTPIPYNIQEAYKMVDEAKGERFSAEKKLADATGQIEAMETQVSTLHNLLKSTPKSSPATKHKKPSVRKLVRKLSRQSIGKHSSKHKEPTAAASPITEHKSLVVGGSLKEGTVSEILANGLTC
jgi:hypothetical protein